MEELLKNSTVRSKIQGLSPPVKKAFIESLLDLYEQETEEMIDVIEESRMELRGDYRSFQDETQNLRAESRMLEDKRKDYDAQCVDRYVQSRASRVSESRMSYVDENSKAVKDYIKKRGKKGPPLAEEIKRSQSSSDRYSSKSRPDSVMTTRSLPTPASLRTVEEEKDEVMKNLSSANQQNEVERQRQADMIAKRREKRRMEKKTTEEKALELLEKAVAMDKMLQERKHEQDLLVRQRLEDAKRKRAESRLGGPESREVSMLDSKGSRDDKKDEKKSEDRHKQRSSDGEDKEKHRRRDSVSRDAEKQKQRTSESRSDDRHKSESRADKHGTNDKRSDSSGKNSSSEKKSERRSDGSDKNSDKRHSSGRSEKREKDKGKEKDKKKESVADYDFSIY